MVESQHTASEPGQDGESVEHPTHPPQETGPNLFSEESEPEAEGQDRPAQGNRGRERRDWEQELRETGRDQDRALLSHLHPGSPPKNRLKVPTLEKHWSPKNTATASGKSGLLPNHLRIKPSSPAANQAGNLSQHLRTLPVGGG